MAIKIIKNLLVLLSVFLPVLIAKIIFNQKMKKWFVKKENSIIPIGVPVTPEGVLLSISLIIITVLLLIIINKIY